MYLHAYLDGELSPQEKQWFEEQLQADPRLRQALEQEREFRARFRARMRQVQAPVSLRARVHQHIAEERSLSPQAWWSSLREWLLSPWRVPRWALVVYTLLVVLLVGTGTWLSQQPLGGDVPHTVYRKLAGKHRVYVYPSPLVDVTGSPDEIATWFTERTSWPVTVPDLPNWTLVGGRVGEFHHQPTLHLIYRQDGRYISLILFAARDSDFPPDARQEWQGREVYVGTAWDRPVILWREGKRGYALIGEVNQPLEDLKRLIPAS